MMAGPQRKGSEMKRIVLGMVVALIAVAAGTTSASAAPINVDATPIDSGVEVQVSIFGSPVEGIRTGRFAGSDTPTGAGVCAGGLIHTSCTPAGQ